MDKHDLSLHCPVCACPLVGAVELCSKCRTPHHEDCTGLIGRCTIFGCGGDTFVHADVERALTEEVAPVEIDAGAPDAARPAVGARRGAAGQGRLRRAGKAFEQAAGFLRIREGDHSLHAGAGHPESYGIVDARPAS